MFRSVWRLNAIHVLVGSPMFVRGTGECEGGILIFGRESLWGYQLRDEGDFAADTTLHLVSLFEAILAEIKGVIAVQCSW